MTTTANLRSGLRDPRDGQQVSPMVPASVPRYGAPTGQTASTGVRAMQGFGTERGEPNIAPMIFNPTTGKVNPNGSPSQILGDLAANQQQYYTDTFRPLNREMIGDVYSNRLVDLAKENADKNYKEGQARAERQRARYGFTQTNLDRAHDAAADTKGLNYDALVNTARTEQYERNVGLRNELINMSRGIARSAMDGLGDAASMEAGRQANNRNISAQNKAQRNQTIGTAISTILMIAANW